ncbi:hypothetical protein [uncultured Gulosibacter sp.]|uniref:hypothetical protein n=1 Tax=uncultured Gulosibacter sp. TaxID=1339167 RepID=UPI002889A50E|nr:hypothetical protein [uncultured Gulosibacter sp.]
MSDNIDFEKMMSEMAQLQREFDESARAARESMRQLVAVQRFGGAAEVIDPERVVIVAVDAAGAPERVQVDSAWRDYYSAEELAQVIAGCAQSTDVQRQQQAREYLDEHPEALDEITDADVQAALGGDSAAAGEIGDPAETIIDMLERLPDLTDEAFAEVDSQALAEPDLENPVQIFAVAGMLGMIQVSPMFIERATNVQLNAALAQAVYDHNNPSEDGTTDEQSTKAKLDVFSARSLAAARLLLSSVQNPNE